MAKIADLIVNLQLESASFRSQVEASRKDIRRFGEDISSSFSTMRNIVTGALGAIGVSLSVDFAKKVLESADNLAKLSQKVGISAQDLSTLEHGLKLSNVPMETFANGVGLLSKALAGFADDQENKGAGAALQALGIKARDAQGSLRPVIDVVLDVADKFKGFEDGVGKTNLALQLFGRSGKELIPFLNEGADGIRKMQDEARLMGLELSGNAAAGAQKFADDLTKLQDELDGATRQILIGFLPAATHVLETLTQVSDKTSAMREFGRTLAEAFQLAVKWALALKLAIQEMYISLSASFQQINDAPLWRKLVPGALLYDFFRVNPKTEDEVNRVFEAYKRLIDELDKAQGKPSLAKQLFGSDADFAKGIEALNQQFPTKKAQPPNLPDADALKKAAEAAKKYAEDLKRATEDIRKSISSGILAGANEIDAPFIKASQELRDNIDKDTAALEKFQNFAVIGPQRVGGLVAGAIRDYLNQIDKIGDEAQKKIDEIIAKTSQLENVDLSKVPVIVPSTLPTLAGNDFYTNFIRSLTANKKSIQKELDDLLGVQQFKHSIDEIVLETGKASAGIGVFFRQYADYATNAAKVAHDAFARVFGALEDQLTNLLAHFKFELNSFIDTIKESIARAVVQKFILGPIAKGLGKILGLDLQKADGSKDAPFHVVVESGGIFGAGGGGSASGGDGSDSTDPTGGIFGKIQAKIGDIFSKIGSFLGKVLSSIGNVLKSVFSSIIGAIGGAFGGGKAVGGDVFPNKFYMVGERGPELFAPNTSGVIIPNHAIGGTRQNNNITNNFYLTPTRSDPFGYSSSQIANAVFTGQMRSLSRV